MSCGLEAYLLTLVMVLPSCTDKFEMRLSRLKDLHDVYRQYRRSDPQTGWPTIAIEFSYAMHDGEPESTRCPSFVVTSVERWIPCFRGFVYEVRGATFTGAVDLDNAVDDLAHRFPQIEYIQFFDTDVQAKHLVRLLSFRNLKSLDIS